MTSEAFVLHGAQNNKIKVSLLFKNTQYLITYLLVYV